MKKSVALLFVFVFLAASCLIAFKPVSAASPNSWASKASMQVARSELGVAVVNGKIYAIGGSKGTEVTGANEEYDPATDTWAFKASMPTPMAAFATAVYQNKIYCIGGGVNQVYDTATDTWAKKTTLPTPRSLISANMVNGKIYVIGGFVPDNSGSGSGSRLAINEVYDPTTDSWTTKTPMPTASLSYISAVVDNEIYITDSNMKNQIYNVETDTWHLGASPLSDIGHGAAGATTGVNSPKRIYVLTEMLEEKSRFNQVYDPKNDMWTFGVAVPTSRLDFGVAVVNDILYVIGGWAMKNVSVDEYIRTGQEYEYTYYATNEQYTPFGYGTPDPSYVPLDIASPKIAVASPENKTYYTVDVRLNFTVNESVSSMRYTLDGQSFTISANMTLAGLTYGGHNVTVYAIDRAGNVGTSDTISFSVAEEPFPVVPVATASVASAALIGVGLLVYYKKRKR